MEISNFINPREIDSRALKGIWYYGEAPSETAAATDNAVNMIVIDKAMGNIKAAANQVMTFDKAKMEEVIDRAKKINALAQGFADGNKEKSRYIAFHKQLIDIAEGYVKKYGSKVNKMPSYYGDIIIVGINLMLVETTAILAEAIISVTTGTNKSIDDYVLSNKKYKEAFELVETNILKVSKELNKVADELYKESLNIGSIHQIESFFMEHNHISLEMEANVSLFRVFKALLFKPLYIILSPVRWIIYMFMLAGYTVADRIQQIKDTIAVYDEQAGSLPPSQRETKIRLLEQSGSKARLDRVETDAKVYKKIEDEKASLTGDVNDTNAKASLAAIF